MSTNHSANNNPITLNLTNSTGLNAYDTYGSFLIPDNNNLNLMVILALGGTIVFILYYQYFRAHQKRIIIECDSQNVTPSDYTVMLSGLDNMTYNEQVIADFCNMQREHGLQIEVKKVSITQNIQELTDLHRKRAKLIHERRKLESKLHAKSLGLFGDSEDVKEEKIEEIDRELEGLESQLESLEARYLSGSDNLQDLSGVVFVSFSTERQAWHMIKKWKMPWYKSIIARLCCCNCFSEYSFEDRIISVKRAPEPTDILFENLAVSPRTKMCKSIITSFMTFITILICAGIVLGVSYIKQEYWKGSVLAYAASFIVCTVNYILVIVIKKFAADEHHYSYTSFYRSISEKLTVAQFINTAIVPLFVYYFLYQSQGQGEVLNNLSIQMVSVFVSNSILTPLMYIADTTYIMKKMKQSSVQKDPSKSGLSQAEANALFEGPQMDISSRYASFMKTIWATGFYGYLIPICIPISIAGLFLGYIADRYLLAHRFTTPIQLGKDIAKAMAFYYRFLPVWFMAGTYLFGDYFYSQVSPTGVNAAIPSISLLGLAIALLNCILSIKIYKWCMKKDIDRENGYTYDQVYLTFQTDYDRANPVTQSAAEEKVLAAYISQETNQDKRNFMMSSLNQMQSKNKSGKHIGSLYKYASTHSSLADHYEMHSNGNMNSVVFHEDHCGYGMHKSRKFQGGNMYVPPQMNQVPMMIGSGNGPLVVGPGYPVIGGPQVVVEQIQVQPQHHGHRHHHHQDTNSMF